jgi:hypothetical protein
MISIATTASQFGQCQNLGPGGTVRLCCFRRLLVDRLEFCGVDELVSWTVVLLAADKS